MRVLTMAVLGELTRQLDAQHPLQPAEIHLAARELASPEVADELKTNFLVALAAKGETASEIAAFAREFRAVAIDPGVAEWAPRAIDIVGTGGDHAGGFNISSLVVFTVASAGVPVMKHGNRGITSKTGSADLLAALGVEIEAPPEKLRRGLTELGFVFFFAPAYHPAFKHISPVRKALAARGQRTVFNVLGPLINPGQPAHVLLGVFAESWVDRMAEALGALGAAAGIAAHGVLGSDRGIDELTTATPNRVRGAGRLREIDGWWHGSDHGFPLADFNDLRGNDLATNLAITQSVLDGRGPAGLVDTIIFNAATALWICGKTASVREGVDRARDLLLGGAVKAKIAATKEFFRS